MSQRSDASSEDVHLPIGAPWGTAAQELLAARHAVEASEARLKGILEGGPDLIVAVDLAGRIIAFNSACAREAGKLFGRTMELGRSIADFPGDAPGEFVSTDHLWERALRGESFTVTQPFADHYYELRYNPIRDADGGISGACQWARDVTDQRRSAEALRQSEERLQLALEGGRMGTWSIITQENRLIMDSRSRHLHGGYPGSDIEEVITRHVHPDDRKRVREGLYQALQEGTRYACEYRVGRDDGTFSWVYARGEPRIDLATKALVSISGIAFDMTDRKNIQEALHKAVEARDTFLGIASHELRTPLTSLMLQSQMHQRNIERQGAAAVTLERMQRIIDSTVTQTTRLARLVDDMLDVSRISSGKLSTRRERLNLSELALDTLSRFKPQLEAAGCVVNCNVAPDVLVDGDVFRLEQVVTNLLTNAVKYAPGKPVDLSVQVRGQRVELKLRDHGAGIRKEHLERIFERFERFESASNVSGLGLGLHISREIVRAHGGEIYAESDLGHGAEFTVVLHAFVAA